MRKNSVAEKGLKVYETFKVRATNKEMLLNALARRGVEVVKATQKDAKTLLITVKFSEKQKFFAITKELCYTDTVSVKLSGRDKPLLLAVKSFGLIVGAAIFMLLSAFFGDFILSEEFTGSGKILKREIPEILQSCGVKEFSRFSSFDLKEAEKKILTGSPRLSFVSCTRRGNRLIIDSVLSEKEKDTLTGNVKELLAEEDGVIEKLKVYRGEAKLKEGDAVKKGDLIADGTATIGEKRVFVGVVARVVINTKKTFAYYSEAPEEEDICLTLAKERFGEDCAEEKITVTEEENGFVYTAELYYLRTTAVG